VRGEGARCSVERPERARRARCSPRARGERDFRLVQGGCMCVSTSCASLCELASQVVYPYYFVDQPVDVRTARAPPRGLPGAIARHRPIAMPHARPARGRTRGHATRPTAPGRGGRAHPVPRRGAAPHAGADNAYIRITIGMRALIPINDRPECGIGMPPSCNKPCNLQSESRNRSFAPHPTT
jgi:hypothetical protein